MFTNKMILSIIGTVLIFGLFVGCDSDNAIIGPEAQPAELPNITSAFRAPAPGDQSIAAIAIEEGFNELVAALVYVDDELETELVEMFSTGTDQYTVFAPTDEAFFALYDALEVDEISDIDAELVLDVLLYHVVEGRRAANSVVPRVGIRTIMTLLEETFTVNTDAVITDIAGQEAQIVTPNISASNGIIHVIDTVILPIE